MAIGNVISCQQYQNFLVSQEPVYDKEILKDIRPYDGLIGYYQSGRFDAYSGVQHTFDRFNSVFPNVTKEWKPTVGAACSGAPCDPVENKIGWGYTRSTYGLEEQSWGSDLLCFDLIMTKTRAKEHFRQIIDDILRPATNWVMTYYLQRKAVELAGSRFVVTAGLPQFNFTWDAGGYEYLNLTNAGTGAAVDATGRLTPDILKSRVTRQYFLGAIMAGKEGYDRLELHTDKDTWSYLGKQVPTLADHWRFGDFGPAAKEFYKYGFQGFIGDFMVKVLQFPLRFNRVSAGRYQTVLPYKNVAATEGIKSEFNQDWDNAQYQFSYINNKRALRVMPFRPEAVNPTMPFMVRDYGGQWKFVTHDLGPDCNGRPIDNSRQNKGKFIADFRVAVKPEHNEWLEAIFHMTDKPCITIVAPCNPDPGYPAQSYSSVNALCPRVIRFTAVLAAGGTFSIDADAITCNGNIVALGSATSNASLATFVGALQTKWAAAGRTGTWTVFDAANNIIQLAGTTSVPLNCDDVQIEFNL